MGVPLASDRPLSSDPPALELRGISKRFGSVHALHGADFVVAPGEVHALLGENGAGKSTLMGVAYGLVRPDAGEIRIAGRSAAPRSPRDAQRMGIGMVHQHATAIPALTVAENVALAARWPLAPATLRRRVLELTTRLGLPLDPDARAESLTIALKQRLEIVKALAAEARVLLLDEPTAVLAPSEAEEFLALVRRFAAGGGAAVLITHKLDEAIRAADRVTVIRHGNVVLTGPAAEQSATSLAQAMIGEAPIDAPRRVRALSRTGSPLVRVERLRVARDGAEPDAPAAVRDVDLAIAAGEIVGIAAVEGNGQRELMRVVAGVLPVSEGVAHVAQPVAFVPEDRTTEGLIPELSLAENVTLGLPDAPWIRRGHIDWRAALARTGDLLETHDVRSAGPGAPAASLSGGNQQKLVLARELARAPRVVVAENPTRGLDVHAAAQVHARLRAAAEAGAAVLLYSSDLDEVLSTADRVVVMTGGKLIDVPEGAGREEIGRLMLRGTRDDG